MFEPVCYFGFSLESRSLELQLFLAVGDFEVKPEIKEQLKLSRLFVLKSISEGGDSHLQVIYHIFTCVIY